MLKNKHWLVLIIGIFAMFYSQDVFADYYSLSMTSSGSQSVEVLMGNDGKGTSISEDQVEVNTTCRYGYNLAIGASVNDNNLYLDGDISNNTAGTFLAPSDGSAVLSSANNTWGFYFNRNTTPSASSVFQAVPGLGSEKASIITELQAPSVGDISDSFSIYYGVAITSTIKPGTYKMVPDNNDDDGAIVYYLTMAENCMPYIIHFDPTTGSGTMADQEAYKDVAVNLSPVSFTAPTGAEFKEWNTEEDGSGESYTDEEEVLDLVDPGQEITLYAIWHQTHYLYNEVAKQSKGMQTNNNNTNTGIQATITKNNSGVYEYNSSVFGADTDGVKQDNTKATIYYYRGILDNNNGTYGSNGDGAAWPNYVVLSNSDGLSTSDTCWRIIRTTGSGGVKMIYNGQWTGSTCANAQTNAQIQTASYTGAGGNNNRRVVRVGYTYNNAYASGNTATNTSVDTLFGSDSNYSVNSTSSNVKTVLDSWYTNNLNDYASILENNAGWCNDRSAFSDASGTTSLTQLSPYGGKDSNYINGAYFGAYARNFDTNRPPSLGCPRNNADVYSVNDATAGNRQLSAPVALITADEASFAGSGSTAGNGSSYNQNSFLRTNSTFLTMSPSYRNSSNNNYYAYVIYVNASGRLIDNGGLTTTSYGVRPVISLKERTEAVSGTGTAVDPWVVVAP